MYMSTYSDISKRSEVFVEWSTTGPGNPTTTGAVVVAIMYVFAADVPATR